MKKIPYKTDQNNPDIIAYKEAVEKGKKNRHVLPEGSHWIVIRGDAKKAEQSFSSQKEAAEYANSVATAGTAVFIHDSDGRIQDRRDF